MLLENKLYNYCKTVALYLNEEHLNTVHVLFELSNVYERLALIKNIFSTF